MKVSDTDRKAVSLGKDPCVTAIGRPYVDRDTPLSRIGGNLLGLNFGFHGRASTSSAAWTETLSDAAIGAVRPNDDLGSITCLLRHNLHSVIYGHTIDDRLI